MSYGTKKCINIFLFVSAKAWEGDMKLDDCSRTESRMSIGVICMWSLHIFRSPYCGCSRAINTPSHQRIHDDLKAEGSARGEAVAWEGKRGQCGCTSIVARVPLHPSGAIWLGVLRVGTRLVAMFCLLWCCFFSSYICSRASSNHMKKCTQIKGQVLRAATFDIVLVVCGILAESTLIRIRLTISSATLAPRSGRRKD